jgi:CAAX protease family protein
MNSANDSQVRELPRAAQWSAILFALGFPSAFTFIYFTVLRGADAGAQHVAYGAGKLIQFLLPVVWIGIVQRRRLKLHPPNTSGLAQGMTMGAVVAVVMCAVYFRWLEPSGYLLPTAHDVKERLAGFQIDTPAKIIAMGGFYALIHSLLEEYYWRWFVFGELRRLVSVPTAIVVSSIAFMGHHAIVLPEYLPWPWAALASAAVAVGGAMWAWLYHRSGSLYAPWLVTC